MERGILRTFKPDGTPVEVYDAEALTKAEFTAFNTYSTDEVDTGMKWIDGKTIYRKVVDCGSFNGTGTTTLNTKDVLHNIEGIFEIIPSICSGETYTESNGIYAPLPTPNLNDGYGVQLTYNTTIIRLVYKIYVSSKTLVTLYYTKV